MRHLWLLVGLLGLIASGVQAATLNIVGGQLMGASGVLVDGSLYDVEFVEGTCIDLFSGCDELSDFTFNTSAEAQAASQALLDQVFNAALGSPYDLYDESPELTNGISGPAVGLHTWGAAQNYDGEFIGQEQEASYLEIDDYWYVIGDGVHSFIPYVAVNRGMQESNYVTYKSFEYQWWPGSSWSGPTAPPNPYGLSIVHARWSPVPEPTTALLLGLGLVGLAVRRRLG